MAAPAGTAGDWVLHHAASDAGSWLRRSASAQTMMVGTGFALLLLLTAGQVAHRYFPDAAADAAVLLLLLISVAAAAPLPALALLHERRRVAAVAIDPTAVTLTTRLRGGATADRAVRLEDLAEVRALAEPTFMARRPPVAHGPLKEIPGFIAVLRFRLADGSTWEFAANDSAQVAGILAWLDVLGAGDKVHHPPSALAARRTAGGWMRWARALVAAAIGAVGGTLLLQAAVRFGAMKGDPLLLSLGFQGLGCTLYVGSYLAQVWAARAWLEGEGLRAGPPTEEPAEAPAAEVPAAR